MIPAPPRTPAVPAEASLREEAAALSRQAAAARRQRFRIAYSVIGAPVAVVLLGLLAWATFTPLPDAPVCTPVRPDVPAEDGVSQFTFLGASSDGRVVELGLWQGTDRAYRERYTADTRLPGPVHDDVELGPPPEPLAFCTVGEQVLVRYRGQDRAFTWQEFREPCPFSDGRTRSWRLCDDETGACALAPRMSLCWDEPVALVDLYGAGDTLWVVAERHKSPGYTPRMAAGVAGVLPSP